MRIEHLSIDVWDLARMIDRADQEEVDYLFVRMREKGHSKVIRAICLAYDGRGHDSLVSAFCALSPNDRDRLQTLINEAFAHVPEDTGGGDE